jgi:hypothetical protein
MKNHWRLPQLNVQKDADAGEHRKEIFIFKIKSKSLLIFCVKGAKIMA